VQGDVIGLVALDLLLRRVPARVMDVALVAHVARVDLHDPPLTRPASEFQPTRSPILSFFCMGASHAKHAKRRTTSIVPSAALAL
jgi:hypothetical protein